MFINTQQKAMIIMMAKVKTWMREDETKEIAEKKMLILSPLLSLLHFLDTTTPTKISALSFFSGFDESLSNR